MINTILLKYKLGHISYYEALKAIINLSDNYNIIMIDKAITTLKGLYNDVIKAL